MGRPRGPSCSYAQPAVTCNWYLSFAAEGGEDIQGTPGDIVSLIPFGTDARGVSTRGLRYALQDESLLLGSSRGLSNIMLASRASVHVREGRLLLVHIRVAP